MFYSLLVSIVLAPFVVHEGLRFYTLRLTCERVHTENALLLENPLCTDPWQRHLHGAKQEQVCVRAAAENAISPTSCAWSAMWTQGEVARVWAMLTESHWMLAAVVVPSTLLTIYLAFSVYKERGQERRLFDFQREMFDRFVAAAPQARPAPRSALVAEAEAVPMPQLHGRGDDDGGVSRKRARQYIQLIDPMEH
jgi:hypothetical protein